MPRKDDERPAPLRRQTFEAAVERGFQSSRRPKRPPVGREDAAFAAATKGRREAADSPCLRRVDVNHVGPSRKTREPRQRRHILRGGAPVGRDRRQANLRPALEGIPGQRPARARNVDLVQSMRDPVHQIEHVSRDTAVHRLGGYQKSSSVAHGYKGILGFART